MTSVTFPPHLGGSGITISDDADPKTGLLNSGHERLFVPGLQGVVDMANYVYQYAGKVDRAANDARRAEEARSYVEAVADAYKVNLLDAYRDRIALGADFRGGRYTLDDGNRLDTGNPGEIFNVTRNSPKWVETPGGKLREVPSNEASREWRNGAPNGLLKEIAATNLIQQSGLPLDGNGNLPSPWSWFRDDGVVEPVRYSLDNSPSVYLLDIYLEAGQRRVFIQTMNLQAGESVTLSFYIRSIEGFTDSTEVVAITSSQDSWQTFRKSDFNGAGRYDLSFTASIAGAVFLRIGPGASGGVPAAGRIVIGAPQLERGLTSSSFILTGDSFSTRAADIFKKAVKGEFSNSAATLLFRGSVSDLKNTTDYIIDGETAGSSFIYRNGTGIRTYDGRNVTAASPPIKPDETFCYAVSITKDEIVTAFNGIDLGKHPHNGSLLEVTRINVLRGTSGTALDVFYIPQALSAIEIQELTLS